MNRELKDPGTPTRSERASVRTQTLKILRGHLDALRYMVGTWDIGRRVFDGGAYASGRIRDDGKEWSQGFRWRRWDEYPENDPGVIARHAVTLHLLADRLHELAHQFEQQVHEARDAAAAREGAES